MIATISLLSESSAHTTASEPVTPLKSSSASSPATKPFGAVHYLVLSPKDEPVPEGYTTIDDIVAEYERDPAMREELLDARRWVADTVLAGQPVTLRTLRLRKGLSQAQLAEAIGTQQPHVARIERGQADPQLATCRRIASALGVDLNTLDQALQTGTGP